ncbi:hypothetical protein QC762_0019000, partial [Podospora pseudocomata]
LIKQRQSNLEPLCLPAHINRELGAPANFGRTQAFFDDVDAPDACISLRWLARPKVVHLGTTRTKMLHPLPTQSMQFLIAV